MPFLPEQVVDVHMDACYKCKEGGDLLCCDGCNCAFHPACCGLDAPPSVSSVGGRGQGYRICT